jgi:halimadienyl-diphosphate synthase
MTFQPAQAYAELLNRIGPGKTLSPSAYDTAWLARLRRVEPELAEGALRWLRANQLPDGSWGAREYIYHHDRVICTLAAIIALHDWDQHEDQARIELGLAALGRSWPKLPLDLAGETIAFETILPSLLDEAQRLGIPVPINSSEIEYLVRLRLQKLEKLPESVINRSVSLSYSSEMIGPDAIAVLDFENLQESNGSVGYSPAATCYYLLHEKDSPNAVTYLNSLVSNGSLPTVGAIDVFETSWTLWNLIINGDPSPELLRLCKPHLDFLEKHWDPLTGIGFGSAFSAHDGDSTSVVYHMLARYGRIQDVSPVLSYETDAYYLTFPLESNSSISTNIHVLESLRYAGIDQDSAHVQKIVRYLTEAQLPNHSWIDKWHSSPYYATSHALIAMVGYVDQDLSAAVQWIVDSQNKDGSWGHFLATAEETAYALQALAICSRNGYRVNAETLERGRSWLLEHRDDPFPPLWIGKCLYVPKLVIEATVLSALMISAPVVELEPAIGRPWR